MDYFSDRFKLHYFCSLFGIIAFLFLFVSCLYLCIDWSDNSEASIVSSGVCGHNLNWELDDDTLTIAGTGPMSNYSQSSNPSWYPYRESISTVIIEEGATSVADYAFDGYSNIVTVSFPSTLTYIGERSFAECTSLSSLNVNYSGNIGPYAFYNCSSLSSVSIEGVKTIYRGAFSHCTSLVTVYLSDSVSALVSDFYTGVFNECSSLASITVDGDNTHYTSVDGVLFDKGITRLFKYPAAKSSDSYIIPGSVDFIGKSAFEHCLYLRSVTISDKVSIIDDDTFYDCSSLEYVSIPDTVTDIGQHAFHNCTSLKSVTISAFVKSIGYAAFAGCTSLTSFTVAEDNKLYYTIDGVLFYKDSSYYPNPKVTLVQYPAGKTDQFYVTPAGVDILDNSSFEGCSHLRSIDIKATTVCGEAFYDCTNLLSIRFPTNLFSVSSVVFPSHCPRYYTSDGVTDITMKPDALRGNLFKGDSFDKLICQIRYQVVYDSDGGDAMVPVQNQLYSGESFEVASYSGSKNGYTFDGWIYGGQLYSPGETITMGTSDITLKASWTPVDVSNGFISPIVIVASICTISLFLGVFLFLRKKL